MTRRAEVVLLLGVLVLAFMAGLLIRTPTDRAIEHGTFPVPQGTYQPFPDNPSDGSTVTITEGSR